MSDRGRSASEGSRWALPVGYPNLVLLLSLSLGCAGEQHLPRPRPAATGTAIPARDARPTQSSRDSGPDGGPRPLRHSSAVDRGAPRPQGDATNLCATKLVAALRRVEAEAPAQRAKPALAGLAQACPEILGPLAAAAARASKLARRERAMALDGASAAERPIACAPPSPLAPAASVAGPCPPPMPLADPLLQDLDAGTYLFVLAVRARLQRAGAFTATADRLLDNLILGAALQGEAARRGR